jgi:hypothetical protein
MRQYLAKLARLYVTLEAVSETCPIRPRRLLLHITKVILAADLDGRAFT